MNISNQLVTPSIAKSYLDANIKNRNVKKPVVLKYSKDMKEGRWKPNTAEMIKLSKTGVILDGQHRLLAVIDANVPIYFHVATGLDDDIFDVLDTGSVRSAGDIFHIEGVKYAILIPAVISMYCGLISKGKHQSSVNNRPTNRMLLEEYNSDPKGWDEVARKTTRWYYKFSRVITTSIIGGVYRLLYDIDAGKAECFFDQLSDGIGVENVTITHLRNKLIQDKVSIRKMSQSQRIALILKAWNYYRIGREVKNLFFNPEKEEYPIAM